VIEIVRYRPRHLRRVLQIERASFPREPYTRKIFREVYEECGELFLIAKVRRRIAGYSATRVCSGHAEVVSIAVDPEYRVAGVGTALLAHTLERPEESGARSVELMVRVDNAAAIRFYRRFGFHHAGRVAGYYEGGQTGLRMRRALGRPPVRK
jgi:ribosomal-protein-alanine N-acetyltransferase